MIGVRERIVYIIYFSILLLLSMTVYTYALITNDILLLVFGFGAMALSFIFLAQNTITLFRILEREIEFFEEEWVRK